MPGRKIVRGSEAAIVAFAEYDFEPIKHLIAQYREILATLKGLDGNRADRQQAIELLKTLAEYRYGKPSAMDSGVFPGSALGLPPGIQINVLSPGQSPPLPGRPPIEGESEEVVDAEIVEAALPDPDWLQ